MASLTLQVPTVGQPNSTEDPKLASDMTAIQAWANGQIDKSNLASPSGILTIAGTLAGRSIAIGQVTLTWAASPYSNEPTVTHGLGVVPAFAYCSVNYGDAYGSIVGNPTSSQMILLGHSTVGNLSTSAPAWWIAIG